MAKKTKKTPHPTKWVQTIEVIDPDTGNSVEVEIRKDTVTGTMVGLDGSWLEQFDDNPQDPYNKGDTLHIPDNESKGQTLPVGSFGTAQEVCPNCQSDNIANEGPAEDGRLFVTCHACAYQWHEPA